MSDHPILFSGPMIRALLDGRKTMTRRIIKPQPLKSVPRSIDILPPSQDEETGQWGQVERIWRWAYGDPVEPEREVWRPLKGVRWTVDDRLWVRETWRTLQKWDDLAPRHCMDDVDKVDYAASGFQRNPLWAWGRTRSSIHMPRWASRITLLVTAVRVERLQAISEADATAEGAERMTMDEDGKFYLDNATGDCRTGFAGIWSHIHGPDAWDADPWVSVTEFERIEG